MSNDNILIYHDNNQQIRVEARFENENIWLTQRQIVELFQTAKSTLSEHIKNIYADGELLPEATVRKIRTVQKEGSRNVTRELEYYNLDMIISLGYRINSKIATQFRTWATSILKEYLKKGFVLNDDRLKNLGGNSYWKELLDRIRDIRSSEKVMYRQVLDLYATAIDYDPNTKASADFFKIVQNKLHYAAHGNTASEIIYFRVDSNKPFAGLTHFKGSCPTQAEAMVAKNYLTEQELRVLNNLVSAYFDLAELNAIEEREMRMVDYVRELDNILSSTGRQLLENSGSISHHQAENKAKLEYKKFKAKTLAPVEVSYLKTINALEKKAKQESRKK
ncbi:MULTISPECIES: virulence RhuM family protein [unclassified Gilliamella]|uniref:virulence RhuM family protein n=1 Tax=unclassified Gilliamella TaxID=2685620 RepID=UPI00080E99FC|nr:virulence RhuM family protein [Gilliamella apicola]OCG35892.1 cell filamentation protein Fic [Gilliamella apicola]OCG50963.1 cell filamentation protein Fic [Gilliamella apicola]OCG54600.1 cell filamentation protein Fic [Gilliamella apicola]